MTESPLEAHLARDIAAYKLPEPVRQLRFAPPRRWLADFAWPDHMLMVEVDGGEWTRGAHCRGRQMGRDNEKRNTATAMGWRVLTFTGSQVRDATAVDTIRGVLG